VASHYTRLLSSYDLGGSMAAKKKASKKKAGKKKAGKRKGAKRKKA
jgi:hypothetical protein